MPLKFAGSGPVFAAIEGLLVAESAYKDERVGVDFDRIRIQIGKPIELVRAARQFREETIHARPLNVLLVKALEKGERAG